MVLGIFRVIGCGERLNFVFVSKPLTCIFSAVRTPSSAPATVSLPPPSFSAGERPLRSPCFFDSRVGLSRPGRVVRVLCIRFCDVEFTSPIAFSLFLFYIVSLFPALQGLGSCLIDIIPISSSFLFDSFLV